MCVSVSLFVQVGGEVMMGTEISRGVCASLFWGRGVGVGKLYLTPHRYHHNDSASDESLYNARLIVRGQVTWQLPINPQLVSVCNTR